MSTIGIGFLMTPHAVHSKIKIIYQNHVETNWTELRVHSSGGPRSMLVRKIKLYRRKKQWHKKFTTGYDRKSMQKLVNNIGFPDYTLAHGPQLH